MFASRNFLFAKSSAAAPVLSGKLFLWGMNYFGQLGQNNTTYRSSPVQVGALTTWSQVSAGKNTLAVNTAGQLWSWGFGAYGRLGLNDAGINRSSPVQVGALTNWAKPSVGGSMSLCIKSDGTLWTWGSNNLGELGQNNTIARSSPVQVGSLTTWAIADVGSTSYSVLATDTAGKLFAWGYNGSGQLGLGDTVYRSSPVQVGALTNWKTPTSGENSMMCTKTDGTLWAWGNGNSGCLGLNDVGINRSSPVQVGALTNWAIPSKGGDISLCTKTDGTLWAWGLNGSGALGLNDIQNRSSPVQIGSLTNWSIPKLTDGSSLCLKTDGTIWSWGSGNKGRLGLGNTTNYSSPKQIGSLTTWVVPSAGYANGGCIQT